MVQDNLNAIQYGINDIRLEQLPIPKYGDDQVLLQMEAVGICGSDVHILMTGGIGSFRTDGPMIVGHEGSATVAETGKNVKNLKVGDRVAIEPGVSCRRCSYCKSGRYNLCPDVVFRSAPPVDGILGRYQVHDADFCFKLPDNVSLDEGALMEPLSVAVYSCKRGNVGVGSIVLVLGAGPIGLFTLLAAKAFGASKVIITDIVEHRLKIAKLSGADYTVLAEENDTYDTLSKKIIDILGMEPTVSLDCSGAELCVSTALTVTRAAGVVVLVGMGEMEKTLPLSNALIREVDVRGINRYAHAYPISLELVSTGKINLKPYITNHFKIEETEEAFDVAKSRKGNPIKILIHPNPSWKPS